MSTAEAPLFDPVDYPVWDQDPSRPLAPEPGEHYWVRLRDDSLWLSCLWCGKVRQHRDTNKPCRGRVRVALR